jgi:hypothetical protein
MYHSPSRESTSVTHPVHTGITGSVMDDAELASVKMWKAPGRRSVGEDVEGRQWNERLERRRVPTTMKKLKSTWD